MTPIKILLFSADASMVHVLSRCIKDAGYKLIHAPNGVGAIDLIQLEKPALIILDMELPGVSSLAIIRALRVNVISGRIPVVLMGAKRREEDVLIGLEVGADLCLLEEFHPQVFIARLRSLIRRTEPLKVY